jgi:alpha-N-arabinofuranosidase
MDVYRDFMAVPEVLQLKWADLRDSMQRAGIKEPKLAVTELQLFAHLGRRAPDAPVKLTRENLPNQGSITEALYDILIYHAGLRLGPFVELVTHSAVVNHGGGLRKERERVWANPCHYAQTMFSAFAESTPVAVEIRAPSESAPMVLPDLKKASKGVSFGSVDALAAITADGTLLVSLVHRGSSGPIEVDIPLPLPATTEAGLETLTAQTPWEGNSREHMDVIKPVHSRLQAMGGAFRVPLQPFTYAVLSIPAK